MIIIVDKATGKVNYYINWEEVTGKKFSIITLCREGKLIKRKCRRWEVVEGQ